MAVTLAGWLAFTRALGLPVLPSSVLLKSGAAASIAGYAGMPSFIGAVLSNWHEEVRSTHGLQFLAGLMMLGIFVFIPRPAREPRQLRPAILILMSAAGSAHLLFGQFLTNMLRYESYVFTLLALTALILVRPYLASIPVRLSVLAFLYCGAIFPLHATKDTPMASRAIYLQQYQMHRFAADYWRQGIGVNDLGWVSYRNPAYVLDLFGLGSEAVRQMMYRGTLDSQALESLAKDRGVRFFMLYDEWFMGLIPSRWRHVATLVTPKVTAVSGRVSFYADDDFEPLIIKPLLERFSQALPQGALLEIDP